MKQTEVQQEALARATNPLGSTRNYYAIMAGFTALGIPETEIIPRENVLTFQAWRALGRTVCKGQHGVKVCTFRTDTKKVKNADGTEDRKPVSRPWMATVFHVSQTKALENA